MSSLTEKLKALGVQIGARTLPAPAPDEQHPLERVISGHSLSTLAGETYVVEELYPWSHPHGGKSLQLNAPLHILAAWAGDHRLAELSPSQFAFLDTETTGLSGGTGTYTFLIGAGRFEGDPQAGTAHFHLAQFFLRDPSEEPAQLAALESFLAPCQAFVTFNGKSFDIPLLATRYLAHGFQPIFKDFGHIDLLHLARRLWRERIPSRTLMNLEAQILGTFRSEDDIPGWMIPSLYFTYLRDGDARPLKKVFYHNAMDVLSLVALLQHMAMLLSDPLQHGADYSLDLLALGRLFEELGNYEMATRCYLHGLDHEDVHLQRLPEPALVSGLCRLAALYRRQRKLPAAIQLWETAAAHQHWPACIELAKIYEHDLHDYRQALTWTEIAIQLLQSTASELPAYQYHEYQAQLKHRHQRLIHKAATRE